MNILDPQGPVGAALKQLLLETTGAMLLVVVPVMVLTLAFAFWYRASNTRARYEPDWNYSGKIELSIWLIPALIVLFLARTAWVSSHDLDPYRPLASNEPPLRVQVVSLDWKWLFILPEQGVASVNELAVPVGRPVQFELTSSSVMNAFFVPQLGSQIYTMPGMQTRLSLQANAPGRYRGISANLSGLGFSDMTFDLISVPAAEFDAWIASARASEQSLDARTYTALAKPSTADKSRLFKTVQPDLYRMILEGRAVEAGPTALGDAADPSICTTPESRTALAKMEP